MNRVYGFLQARSSSTRLPNKVLRPILNRAMIIHELERVSKSRLIDELILLTSSDKSDDELAYVVKSSGFRVYRGDLDDVLGRFFYCAQELGLEDNDIIVRLTGDCPLHDSNIIDSLIGDFKDSDCDYMANCVEPILYPDGLDAEVFYFWTLKEAFLKAKKLSQREHVTPYIRDSGEFKVCGQIADIIHPDWRLTVDEEEDFLLIEKIFNHFNTTHFSFDEIVKYLEANPDILEINKTFKRNEGYEKSLQNDGEYNG